MLKLHTSNRLETLAEELAQANQRPLSSVLQPELVVVQSQGMARWLKLELAGRLGVCANYSFPFPKVFCSEVLAAHSGRARHSVRAADDPHGAHGVTRPTLGSEESLLDREVMLWAIMRVLPEMLDGPEFSPLKGYLSDAADIRKRFQLSSQIANLFDQYLVFRPDLILAWDQGQTSTAGILDNQHERWQAALWRRLHEVKPGQHLAALLKEFGERAARPEFGPLGVPERISIFGISALPPSYLQIFCALGARVDVHLFLLQPSKEYWGLIVNARESERLLKAARKGDAAASELHLEAGNRLLASTGQLGRDFLNLVLEAGDWDEARAFSEPPETNLLQHLQDDLFNLRDRGQGDCPRLAISRTDDSLRVHACHSPLREVEVLYDHLLDWLGHDPKLTPRDVLVMTPDIEAYAPFVQAVFDSPEEASKRIPFSVADQGICSASQVVDAFLNLLSLPATRLETTSVLHVLETEAVREKFGLGEADLDIIRVWVRKTNIRWGRDARQRESLGLPGLAENTWQQGMERLFTGYAMAGKGVRMFQGVLPYDDVEGGSAEVLGHFAEYLKRLFDFVAKLKERRSIGEWEELLLAALEAFFQPDESQVPEALLIRSTLRALAGKAAEAGCVEVVDLAVILESLNQLLAEDRFGSGFITGGVTFCALKPMRSIPFKVICLIGMNDGAFPRTDRHLSFDLIAQKPRLGDRSLRADDRYLFLETLLSARERLHLSYVGQSIRDNSEAPPSVLVRELLDYVAQAYDLPGQDIVNDHVLVRHRLQAFSPAYFTAQDPRLFSYSAENCRASCYGQTARARPASFLDVPLSEPEAEWRTVDAGSLAEFFCNPARWLVTRRLGLRFEEQDEALEEVEPFAVAALDGYAIRQDLVNMGLKGTSLKDALQLMKASGRLPLGETGAAHFRGLQADVQAFLEQLRPRFGEGYIDPIPIDRTLGEFRLVGEVKRLTAKGSLHFRCASVKPKDLLRFWVQHLVLNAAFPGGPYSNAVLVGSDKVFEAPPLGQAPEFLAGLLALYWNGLSRPLKFFPQTAWAYADAVLKQEAGRSRQEPLEVARVKWEGSSFTNVPGECEDPYFDLCFRNTDPLDEEFQQTARVVFGPLLSALKEVEA
jgi:exodeoxyribonuclease V gamma subunit